MVTNPPSVCEVPLALMFPLAVMCPVTFIPPSDVSNLTVLSCLNSTPAPCVNKAIVLPSFASLILTFAPLISKSPAPKSLITLLSPL